MDASLWRGEVTTVVEGGLKRGVLSRVRRTLATPGGTVSREDREEISRRMERLRLRYPGVAAMVSLNPALAEEV